MRKEDKILVAQSNDEQFNLIEKNLLEAEKKYEIIRFTAGEQVLYFLSEQVQSNSQFGYVLLLDLEISQNSDLEVLEKIKADETLKKIPVIIFASNDEGHTVDRCLSLGCSMYIVKPEDRGIFIETVKKIGGFLSVVQIAPLNS